MSLASEFSLDGAALNASLLALDSVTHEPVQLKLLAWVMGLPTGADPAVAAQLVISHQTRHSGSPLSGALMRLIETVSQYPQERLAHMARRRRALH